MTKNMEVYTVELDGNRLQKLQCDWWTCLIFTIRLFLSCVHAAGNLVYDLTLFVLLFVISTYASQFLVYISCFILSYFVDAWPLRSLLEVEVSTIVLVFIVAEIQPEFEKRCRPKWAPKTSCLTEYITNFCHIMLASSSVPMLIMAIQSRFCDENIYVSRLTGPFEAFMVVLRRCQIDCSPILESPWENFQERAPLLLSLCFMVAANFLTKLYVNGKENGVNVLLTCTGLMCKLICPIRMVPNELRLDGITVKYFFFGMIHELAMFFALMVFPTIIIVDLWSFMQDGSEVVGRSGNWLFALMILGFPAVYFASYVDECTINMISAESKMEPRGISEKRRLGLVQGGLTCDLVVCLGCLVGTLCYFFSNPVTDVCLVDIVAAMDTPNRVYFNMTSQTVQNLLVCITFFVYAAVKMLVVCDWVPEPNEIVEKLLSAQDDVDTQYVHDPSSKPNPEVVNSPIQHAADVGLAQVKVHHDKAFLVAPCGIHV